MSKGLFLNLVSDFLNEAVGNAKSEVNDQISNGYKKLKMNKLKKEIIQDVVSKYSSREDAPALQNIDITGIQEHTKELASLACLAITALTESDRIVAERNFRMKMYQYANCNESYNELLESLIKAVEDVIEHIYREATNEEDQYLASTAARDLRSALLELEKRMYEKIDSFYPINYGDNSTGEDVYSHSSAQAQEKLIKRFYEEIISRMTQPIIEGGDLFGYEPLNDVYITPFVIDGNKKISVFNLIEKRVSGNDLTNAIIVYGEPGHGKTSLCWKAAYEFKCSGWLKGRFKNVFRFSLNTSSFDIEDKLTLLECLDINTYLKIQGNPIDPAQCKNSLIFLDGFDELYDNINSKQNHNFSMKQFIDHIIKNNNDTFRDCYFVITSRKMCIEHELTRNLHGINQIAGVTAYEICKMDRYDQDNWIQSYELYLRKKADNSELPEEAIEEFLKYALELKSKRDDDFIKELLEIPILFRMVIHCRFLPDIKYENYNRAHVYSLLFHETMTRHGGDETAMQLAMERIAYSIFLDNDDSASLDDIKNANYLNTQDRVKLPAWVYSFYTKYKQGRKRILFIHRSFYQYFLACFIYRYIMDIKEETLREEELGAFGRRRISNEVFDYLSQLLDEGDHEILHNKGKILISELEKTEAILSNRAISQKYSISPLNCAGNVFCNIISVLSVLKVLPSSVFDDVYIDEKGYGRKPLVKCLKRYSCNGIIARGVIINNADLRGADFRGADFSQSTFRDSVLNGAILSDALLRGAVFKNTNLKGSIFSGANLEDTEFSMAHFRGAFFRNVRIKRTIFRDVDIDEDVFKDVDFSGAIFKKTEWRV